jgi:hypothetical protein
MLGIFRLILKAWLPPQGGQDGRDVGPPDKEPFQHNTTGNRGKDHT